MTDRSAKRRTTDSAGHLRAPARTVGRRLAWLVACVGVGALVGGVGSSISGDDVWFVAIPAAMAIGWLFVADPAECESPGLRRPGD